MCVIVLVSAFTFKSVLHFYNLVKKILISNKIFLVKCVIIDALVLPHQISKMRFINFQTPDSHFLKVVIILFVK